MQLLDDHLWKMYDDLERARFPADLQAKIDEKARGQAGLAPKEKPMEDQPKDEE